MQVLFLWAETPVRLSEIIVPALIMYCPHQEQQDFHPPLGVYDFQKRSSLIFLTAESASELGIVASVLANGEGLQAHAEAAKYRVIKNK